jgi:ParB family transcriptional regulator, chromosome partitioning protein
LWQSIRACQPRLDAGGGDKLAHCFRTHSAGHARVLLSYAEPDSLAAKIVAQNLSVREAEKLLEGASESSHANGQTPRKRGAGEKDADTRAMEKKLMEQLGMNVTITPREGETGEVAVRYKTLDQLEFLCGRLRGD